MEEGLDEIARGEAARVPWLRRFYFGADGEEGLKELVSDLTDIDAREVSSFPLAGSDIVIRVGRYGPYLERGDQRVNIPEGTAPDELTVERAEELFDQPSGDRPLGTDPATGHEIVARAGRFGPYVTEQPGDHPGNGNGSSPPAKPRSASLLQSMSLETVTLADALKLLSLPRLLGELDGEPVTAQNGRYGPYVKKGTDSRSLDSEEQLFDVTLTEAEKLFAQPKPRGRRASAAAAPALRELGPDPASGKPMVIKDGRWGPYVTDGETNASLRKGDAVESVTPQRGAELLAERRQAAPSAPRRTSRSPSGTAGKSRSSSGSARKTRARPGKGA
jgi:DNA topoisomerase-1